MSDLGVFDEHLRQWAYAACVDWGYPPPPLEWFEAAHRRLPVGLRTEVGRALNAEAVTTVEGHRFVVDGGGGPPYSWFSQSEKRQQPVPNWEYFVQVAEYARICSLTAVDDDLRVGFEDELMDITVRRGDDLLWYIEAKETFAALAELARELARIGADGIDHDADDRADDPLRTAKLIVDKSPAYVSIVAVGGRLDYSVIVHDLQRFELLPDLVPVGARL